MTSTTISALGSCGELMPSPNISNHPSGRLISRSNITAVEPSEIFVFGSNSAGKHRGGAARLALERFGAVYGEGHGLHGQSFAIDTMSGLGVAESEVRSFLAFANANPQLTFLVTEIGTGRAGHKPEHIAPLFQGAPDNVALPRSFATYEVNAYREAWEHELLSLSAALFADLGHALDDSGSALPAGWLPAHPLWDASDLEATRARIHAALTKPSQPNERWHNAALFTRALYEQGRDDEAVRLGSQIWRPGAPFWLAQVLNLAEGRALESNGKLRISLDRYREATQFGSAVPGWDPDLVLRALCGMAFLDTSWLGGNAPRSFQSVVAQVALGFATRVRRWRGPWYESELEDRLHTQVYGPGYVRPALA